MRSELQEKRMVVTRAQYRYQRATKKEKGTMLDYVSREHGYNRRYAACLLRGGQRTSASAAPEKRGRPAYYRRLYPVLKRIWGWYDYVCSTRVAAILPEAIEKLAACGELVMDGELREQLRRVSARTIDRLLAADRRALVPRRKTRTRPGSLLKHQVPIKTFAEWQDSEPGYVAMDCVAHDGGSACGDYNYTLVMTNVATGWTELRAVHNKAQTWVFAALLHLRTQFPFTVRGIHSDNGSEFINAHLTRWCAAEKITFTRSRPRRANDNCHVEQKNWSMVRRAVGHGRHVDDEARLNRLYDVLRLFTNYCMPVMKCIAKTRHGSRVTRHYDGALTPYARLLASAQVTEAEKARQRAIYAALNPVALKREITRLQGMLARRALRHMAGCMVEAI